MGRASRSNERPPVCLPGCKLVLNAWLEPHPFSTRWKAVSFHQVSIAKVLFSSAQFLPKECEVGLEILDLPFRWQIAENTSVECIRWSKFATISDKNQQRFTQMWTLDVTPGPFSSCSLDVFGTVTLFVPANALWAAGNLSSDSVLEGLLIFLLFFVFRNPVSGRRRKLWTPYTGVLFDSSLYKLFL